MRLFYLFSFSINNMTPYIYAGLADSSRWNFQHNISELGVHGIINAVAKSLSLDAKDIIGMSRKKQLVEARCIAIAIIIDRYRDLTLEYIGSLFNRHYSTIIYNRDLYAQIFGFDRNFTIKARKVLNLI